MRLASAKLSNDLTNKAIELGVALEVLLLHDIEEVKSEISFRAKLRGSFLINKRKKQNSKLISDLYDLRSKAVHGGTVIPKKISNEKMNKIQRTLARGENLLAKLLRTYINKGNFEWDEIIFKENGV